MKKYLCLIISLLNAVATAIYIALIDKDIVPIHYDFYGNCKVKQHNNKIKYNNTGLK